MAVKKCTRCGIEKPHTEFHSGAYQCRSCKSKYDKKRRLEHRERINKAKREYYADPEVRKLKSEYDREYRKRNREAIDARRAEWAKSNPEKSRRYALTAAHRRRTLTKTGASSQELKEWADVQEKVCHWCGCGCGERFEIDHYLPISLGGVHETSNFVISCVSCNRKKHAKHPAEFAASIGRLL